MTNLKVSTHARVRVTLDIPIGGGAWSDSDNLGAVHRAAKREVLEILRKGIEEKGWSIVDEPKVTAILVEEAT